MDEYTLVKDGSHYHTDAQTHAVLKLVQRIDPDAAHDLFNRWHDSGRIQDGIGRSIYREPVLARAPGHGIER